MDLYLHIGTEKTGTSSLQDFCKHNREVLREHGILYPAAPGPGNHKALAAAAQNFGGPGELHEIYELDSQNAVDAFRAELKSRLADEIHAQPYTKAVMSNEHLSSRLTSDEEVKRLHDMLAEFFDKTYVVVYLRRQDEYLLSSYSTSIKSGKTQPLALPGDRLMNTRYDHWNLLSRWAKIFGRKNIVARKYERSSLLNNDIVDDFFSVAHIDRDLAFAKPRTKNESLDADALEFLRLFNLSMEAPENAEASERRPPIVRALAEISKGPLVALPDEDLKSFMDEFRESNRKVALEYFGGEITGSDDSLFALRPTGRARAVDRTLTAERAVAIAAHVLVRAQQRRDKPRIKKDDERSMRAKPRSRARRKGAPVAGQEGETP